MDNEIPVRWKVGLWNLITALWNMITSRFDAIDSPMAAQSVALDKLLNLLGNGLIRMENYLMTVDEALKALKDQNDSIKAASNAAFAEVGAALNNIKADEASILAKIETLNNLNPDQQAIVDSVIADSKALAISIQTQADGVKAVADSIADAPPAGGPVEP